MGDALFEPRPPSMQAAPLRPPRPGWIALYFQPSAGGPFTAPLLAPPDCAHVASIQGEGLAGLFERTQHFDQPWYQAPGAEALTTPLRSLSVGDYALFPDGACYLCADLGWKRVDAWTGIAQELP
jgi:hypothetical protein